MCSLQIIRVKEQSRTGTLKHLHSRLASSRLFFRYRIKVERHHLSREIEILVFEAIDWS